MNNPKGSVLVIGGGISGIQTALDMADSGLYVHLVESSAAIGGSMGQLDKTFPTNDCSACILSPKLVECGRHLNINLLTLSELVSLDGAAGNFKAVVRQKPRYVDPAKCIACGKCAEKCPKSVPNEYNLGIGKRKAIYLKFPQAVPLKYAIDAKNCIWLNKPGRCGACAKECPAGAINFDEKPVEHVLEVGAVVMAPGFKPYDPSLLDFTGYGRVPNVVTSMEFERLLSPSGPCLGHVERASDKKTPRRIAWLQCVGSRDKNRACHAYCSSVCCMYAIKQAVIAKEHMAGELSAKIFFMDMRTHGKGFEAYFERAKADGIGFERARVHSIIPAPHGKGETGDVLLRFANENGEMCEEVFDMAVLSIGLELDSSTVALASKLGIDLNGDGFLKTQSFMPVLTQRQGVFVCGAASEPKDIPQSVTEASAAAAEVEKLLASARWKETKVKEYPSERDLKGEPPRIGVFVCHCGINIASVVNVKAVTEYAKTLPHVVFSQNNLFTCSQDTIVSMTDIIKREGLNRVVVASCSPRTHEPLFQETLREAGLNRFLFEMANIRDQDSWVHQSEPEKATQKAKELVKMAVAKVASHQPLSEGKLPVTKGCLVIGGGVSGMQAALNLAEQGFAVTLIEKGEALGGQALKLVRNWEGLAVAPVLSELAQQTISHPNITVRFKTQVKDVEGSVGRFKTTLSDGSVVEHGAAIIAVGAEPWVPQGRWQYGYGVDARVKTLHGLDEILKKSQTEALEALSDVNQAVFMHCVGSRIPERPYCSRVCCSHAIEQAIALKDLKPKMDVFMLYRDVRTYGRREHIYEEARSKGVIFVRYDLERLPKLEGVGARLELEAFDPVLGRQIRLSPDLLVLATAITPRKDAGELSKFFKCAINADGFLMEAHAKLRPVDFATEGVFLAGLCHYPKPIEESIVQASAAAARAAMVLAKDFVPTEAIVAEVTPAKCVTCGVCGKICPYKAISKSQVTGKAEVNPALCKGCGACVAGCRSDAIRLKNFANKELIAAISAGGC